MLNRATQALVFPLGDRECLTKIAIGGGIGLLLETLFVAVSFLLTREFSLGGSLLAQAANFPALGFVLATFEGALAHPQTDSLPPWKPWSNLCVKGLFLFALTLAHEIVPALFVISGFGLLVKAGTRLVLGIVLIMVGMLAGITAGFFLPMGVARYLSERRLEAALHPAIVWLRIRKVLTEYVEAYLLSLGSLIIAGLIGAIPILGLLLWPFVTFYLFVAGARLFGGICSSVG
ncbi:MAG: hypothetical protein C3F08_06375 [Candidatus Methylomirabilota bacterium]|nr:MAG: hypothetical protein C3F08_06375 [candidate division NC10 bacterium]